MITEKEVMEVKQWLDKIKKKHGIKGQITDKIVLKELEEEAKKKEEKPRKERKEKLMKGKKIVDSEFFMTGNKSKSWKGIPAFNRAMKENGLKFHFVNIWRTPNWQNDTDSMVFWIEKGEIIGFAKFIWEMTPDDFMEMRVEGKTVISLYWYNIVEI